MPSKNQRSKRSTTRGRDSERLTITIPRRLRASPSDASSTTKTSLARRSTRSSHHPTSPTPATTPAGIPELVEHRDHSVPLIAEEEADLDVLSRPLPPSASNQCGITCRNPSASFRHRKMHKHSGDSTLSPDAVHESESAGDDSEEDEGPSAPLYHFPAYRLQAGQWTMVSSAPVFVGALRPAGEVVW
ncbi:hypothetical protein BC835DRAFT_449297 [Cytidiella melzeri]|nr:hypothetical protein BC835DRAFT_449297 [Cytidiella melzeri]